MRIDDEEKRYVVSSGNVFADVGLPDAEGRMRRSKLLNYLVKEIRRRGLSPSQAAVLLNVPDADVHHLLQANLTSFSFEGLIEMVARLGMDVSISCQPAQDDDGHGHITINLPQSA